MTTEDSPLSLKCPFACDENFSNIDSLIKHLKDHSHYVVVKKLARCMIKLQTLEENIQKELQRLESLHLDFDRFATTQVAGQITLLKGLLEK